MLIAAIAVGLAGGADAAVADPEDPFRRDRNHSVLERPRPEYAAPGVPAGGFRLFPEVEGAAVFNDNIFAAAPEADAEQDVVYELRGRLDLESQWSSHAINIEAEVASREYSEFSDESTTDWMIGADGRLDILRGYFATVSVSHSELHETRDQEPLASGIASPVEYSATNAAFEIVRRFNRLMLSGRARYTEFDYEDADLVGGGVWDEDDRDRTVTEIGGRVEYALADDRSVFFALTHNTRDYRDARSAAVRRDSSGVEVLAGANFDLTHLVRGEVGIGYLDQSYDDPSLSSVSGLSSRFRVEWYVDPLVTVTLAGARAVEDASVLNAGGYLRDQVNLNVDYEWRRNVLAGLGAEYGRDDYNGIDRTDERQAFTGTLRYLMNRRSIFEFEIANAAQDSAGSESGREYEINELRLGVRLRR